MLPSKCTDKPTWSAEHVEECFAQCVVYGQAHFITFDGKEFTHRGDCKTTLARHSTMDDAGIINYY